MTVTDALEITDNDVCPLLPVHLLKLMAERNVIPSRVQGAESIRGPGSAPGFLKCLLDCAKLEGTFRLHEYHYTKGITMEIIADATTAFCIQKYADGGLLTLKWKEGLTDEAVLHTWSFTYCPGAGVIFCSWGMCHEAKYEFVKSFDLKGDVEMAHWCLIEEVEPEQPRFERKKHRAVE